MKPRRSILAVPADHPRFHAKAEGIPADEIMFDLEDSVAESKKDAARRQLIESLKTFSFNERIVAVRVNGLTTRWFEEDIEAAVRCERVESIVIPKVGSSDDIRRIEQTLRALGRMVSLEPQIESAAGLVNAARIASASSLIEALHFGPLDLAASIGMPAADSTMPDDVYTHCLLHVLVAARASGQQAIDGPYTLIGDEVGLRHAAERAARLGYDGKWAIHPGQVQAINSAFTPSEADRLRARSVLDAYANAKARGHGAIELNGAMIDEAVVRWAEVTTSRAAAPIDRDKEAGSDAGVPEPLGPADGSPRQT